MRVLLGAVVGILLVWLYRSKRVREEAQRRLATVPEPLRHAATSARAASASQIERVAQAFEAAPVPQPLRDALGRATMAARSTAEKLGGTPVAGPAATLSVQELPDGSWIGDADLGWPHAERRSARPRGPHPSPGDERWPRFRTRAGPSASS